MKLRLGILRDWFDFLIAVQLQTNKRLLLQIFWEITKFHDQNLILNVIYLYKLFDWIKIRILDLKFLIKLNGEKDNNFYLKYES